MSSPSPRAARIATALVLLLVLLNGLRYADRSMPVRYSYNQDAVAPLRALGFLERYADLPPRLTDKYPVFAYLWFGAAARIALFLRGDEQAAALLEKARAEGPNAWVKQIDPELWIDEAPYTEALAACIVAGRIASTVANVLLALGAALLAAQLGSRGAAPVAALLFGFHPYCVWYGGTMNVDVPCLAFAFLGLALLVRALRTRGTAAAAGAGALLALAVATKDQIAGYVIFLAPAVLLLEWRWRRGEGRVPIEWRCWTKVALAFLATYALAANWVFAPDAWLRHARYGLSPEVREQYRMAEMTPAGLFHLAAYTGTYFVRSAGLAGALLMLAGGAYALWWRRAATVLLLLPALGYFVVFVLRMGLTYPRHLLAVFLPMLLLGACCTAHLLAARGWRRGLGVLLLAAAALVAWRGFTVARLIDADPRTRAAAWLAERVGPEDRVLAITDHATPPPAIPLHARQRWASARDVQQAFREIDPNLIVRVDTVVLKNVVFPEYPRLPEEGSVYQGLVVEKVFGRELFGPEEPHPLSPLLRWLDPAVDGAVPRPRLLHPLLDDVNTSPVVVVFRRP